jgi:hypothetical protein
VIKLLIPKRITEALTEENKKLLMQAQSELSTLFVQMAAGEEGAKRRIEYYQQQGVIQQIPAQAAFAQPQPQIYGQVQQPQPQYQCQQPHQYLQPQQFPQSQQQYPQLQPQQRGQQAPYSQQQQQQQQLQQYIQYYRQPVHQAAPPSYEALQAMERQEANGSTTAALRTLFSTLYRNR